MSPGLRFLSFRTWFRRFRSALVDAFWGLVMKGLFVSAGFGVEIDMSQLQFSSVNWSFLTGGSLKIVGVIIALAVLGILGGLAFFNASQQKGINNSIGIAIIVLPVALLLWMVQTAISSRRR